MDYSQENSQNEGKILFLLSVHGIPILLEVNYSFQFLGIVQMPLDGGICIGKNSEKNCSQVSSPYDIRESCKS